MTESTPELSRLERGAVTLLRRANENPTLKRLQHHYLYNVSRTWMRKTIDRRTYVDGIDWLRDFEPPGGVLLAANHRSFFDQYAVMVTLKEWGVSWTQRLYFPVRSNFFYETPLGVLVNLAVGGGAMYPPIFRDRNKARLNDDALDQVTEALTQPGTVVGMHPEGTRNKGPDPYDLLPAQPGVGRVILRSRATVIPIFINGLSNALAHELQRNYARRARESFPIVICVGQPVDYSEFTKAKPRLALYKRCADRVRDAITALGDRERALRAACSRGEIPADAPGWFANRTSLRAKNGRRPPP